MTLKEALDQGYTFFPNPNARVGYLIKTRKAKPFGVDMEPIGWDRHGPRFPNPYYEVYVTLQNQEEVDMVQRKEIQ